MLKKYDLNLHTIVLVILLAFGLINTIEAGTCWVKRMESGKCKQPLSRNVSKEDCCSAGPDVGFTEKEMNEFEYFFATAIGDGTSCAACIESCETAKCGFGKRCVMRKGQPKCVCSPICKASKNKSNKSFNVLNSESKISENSQVESSLNQNSEVFSKRSSRQQQNLSSDSVFDDLSDVSLTIGVNKSFLPIKSDRIISLSSSSVNNLNSPSSRRKNKENLLNLNKIDNNNNNISKKITHKNRHNKKKYKIQNEDSRIYDGTVIPNWEDKIRTGFIGYDLPYPPNEFSLSERGPYYNPVCGTDGRTYKTECQLKKRACRQETSSLTVAYRGQCQTSCKNVICPNSMHCLEDQNLMPHCIKCSMKCPPYENSAKSHALNPSKLICGTDGNTYRNLCEIKRAACIAGRAIPVAYRGSCKDFANCNNIKCKDRQICLNDLITHRPRCVSCSFKCPRRRRPQGQREHIKICGVNDMTYNSWCQMMKDSCQTGHFIDVKHNGMCQKANGTSPLTVAV